MAKLFTLTAICEHLGVLMSSTFVAETLGVPHHDKDKRSFLYTEAGVADIHSALAKRCANLKGMPREHAPKPPAARKVKAETKPQPKGDPDFPDEEEEERL